MSLTIQKYDEYQPAVAYLRRSTDRQEQSIGDHRKVIRRYADENGYQLLDEYVDDAISGTLITGNVFFRCSPAEFGAVQIHGGKDNWVDGNVAIEGQLLVSFTPWTEAKWTSRFGRHKGTLFGMPVNQPPWSERYPELARIGEDPNINHHWGNIAYNCERLFNREPPGGDAIGNALLASPFPPGPEAPTLADLARVLAKEPLLPIPLSEIGTRGAP